MLAYPIIDQNVSVAVAAMTVILQTSNIHANIVMASHLLEFTGVLLNCHTVWVLPHTLIQLCHFTSQLVLQ
jgi:hypothetical protein